MEIGSTMQQIRTEQHLTRKEMAAKIGITAGALWKVEAGRTTAKQQTIQRFLEATGVSRAEFYLRSINPEDDIPQHDYLPTDIMDIIALAINKLYRHRRYD